MNNQVHYGNHKHILNFQCVSGTTMTNLTAEELFHENRAKDADIYIYIVINANVRCNRIVLFLVIYIIGFYNYTNFVNESRFDAFCESGAISHFNLCLV